MKKTISTVLLGGRPQELGKIKIGGKGESRKKRGSEDTYQLPVKYDHFVVTTRVRGDDGNFEKDESVHAIVGDKPMELDCVLAFDTVEESFQSSMQVYKGKTKVLQCDGEMSLKVETGEQMECPRLNGGTCPCKPYGRLAVMLEADQEYGGFRVFRTTSWESVANIQSTLQMFELQFGSLRGLPLKLKLYLAEVQYEQDGSQRTGEAWKVGLVLRASHENARAAAIEYHRSAQIARSEIKALAAGTETLLDAIDVEEAADFAEEFHPELPPTAAEEASTELAEAARGKEDVGLKATDAESERLNSLMDQVSEASGLDPQEEERWNAALERNDGDAVRAAIDTLTERLDEDLNKPATRGEVKQLRHLMDTCDIEFEEAEILEQAMKDKNGPAIRHAIKSLQKKAIGVGA